MVAGAATVFSGNRYPEETQWQLATEKTFPVYRAVSGLTWNPDSGTLFAVTDHPSSVVELDTDGNVLRVIPSDGDHDFEAIEYLGRTAMSCQGGDGCSTHHIGRNTSVLPPASTPCPGCGQKKRQCRFFEGLARGRERMPLMMAQEKKPLRF